MDKLKAVVEKVIESQKYVSLNYFRSQFEYINSLKMQQKNYVRSYVSTDGSILLNAFIRNNFIVNDKIVEYYNKHVIKFKFLCIHHNPTNEQMSICLLAFYNEIQNIILNAPKTDKEIIVYRGLKTIEFFKTKANVYHNNNGGIFSTSFDIDIAKIFSDNNYLLKIIIPKGFSCLMVGDLLEQINFFKNNEMVEKATESEIILPNNTSFKIIKNFYDEKDYKIAVIKLITTDELPKQNSVNLYDEKHIYTVTDINMLPFNTIGDYNYVTGRADNLDLSLYVRVKEFNANTVKFINKHKIQKLFMDDEVSIDHNAFLLLFGLTHLIMNSVNFDVPIGITFAHLSQLKYLKCSNIYMPYISIYNLTNLEHLNCRNSKFTDLFMNNNISLKYLDLASTYMTKLNVTECANLEYLNISGSKITDIDISNLVKLKQLRAVGVKVNTPLCINSPSMTHLIRDFSDIKIIDINNLTSLVTVSLCGNLFTSIDVSNLVNLEFLYISRNKIQNIDVSKLIKLKTLNIMATNIQNIDVSNLVNLESLDISRNKIQNIDVSNLVKLKSLNIADNNIQNIDVSNLKQLTDFKQ